jgi:hypothetical protein
MLGRGKEQNKPWVLVPAVYKGVQLERCGEILTLQNKIDTIMVVSKPRTSFRSLFKN